MTAAKKLTILEGEGLDAWHRKLAELIDGEGWHLADSMLEQYPLDEYPDLGSAHNGLKAALDRDVEVLRRQFGIVAKANHLRDARSTAIAWPPAARAAGVPFAIHRRIRGEKRQDEMTKRVRQAEQEGFPLTVNMLARFRAEEKPKQPGRPYNERMKRAIVAAVKREMLAGLTTKRDDWWMVKGVSQTTRDVAVQELRALASAINRGAIDG